MELSIFDLQLTPLSYGYGLSLFASGDGEPPPLIVSVSPSALSLTIVFDSPITLAAPSSDASLWRITKIGGAVLPVTHLAFDGTSTVTLTTAEHVTGDTYTLTVPSGVIAKAAPHVAYPGPYLVNYTGVGVSPTVLLALAMSYRSVRVTFDEAVIESEALNKSNYMITGGVYITGVTKISDTIYELSTSPMVGGTSYTVTASNIHDTAGNLI